MDSDTSDLADQTANTTFFSISAEEHARTNEAIQAVAGEIDRIINSGGKAKSYVGPLRCQGRKVGKRGRVGRSEHRSCLLCAVKVIDAQSTLLFSILNFRLAALAQQQSLTRGMLLGILFLALLMVAVLAIIFMV